MPLAEPAGSSVTDWLTVGIAMLALTAAAWAARSAHRTDATQAEQLELAHRHSLRQQASHVAAWLIEGQSEPGVWSQHLYFLNASKMPVFDVEFSALGNTDGAWLHLYILEPRNEPELLGVLDGEDLPRVNLDPRPAEHADRIVRAQSLHLKYTDAEGNRWSRDRSGTLSLIREAGTDEEIQPRSRKKWTAPRRR